MVTIHEIDNDGRGANTWEVTDTGYYLISTENFENAVKLALHLGRIGNKPVSIYPIEWYDKEDQ